MYKWRTRDTDLGLLSFRMLQAINTVLYSRTLLCCGRAEQNSCQCHYNCKLLHFGLSPCRRWWKSKQT